MKLFERETATAAFEKLLKKERAAILASDFETLAKLSTTKETLLERVAAEGPKPDSLVRIQQLSNSNNALLTSAGKGIKAALNRIEELRAGPKPLKTYGPAGERQDLGHSRLTIERKA